MIIGQELVINGCLCHGDPRITNTSLVVKVRVMAPTRSRKVRCQELQVTNNPAGAQADGGHHHLNSKTQSIVPPVDIAEANTTANLKRTAMSLAEKVMFIQCFNNSFFFKVCIIL